MNGFDFSMRASRTIAAAGVLGAVAFSVTPSVADAQTTVRMVLWPGPEGDAMQKVVRAYNNGQGKTDGISVDMVLLSRDDTFAKETTEIATRSSNVDIYFTATYNIGFFAQGLEPIDDIGIDKSKYFSAAIKGLTIDGKLYGVPLDVSNHFLYYRTDLVNRLLKDESWKKSYRDIARKVLGEARDPKKPSEWTADDYLATAAFFSRSENPDSPTRYGTALQAKTSPFNITLWDDLLWGLGGSWTGKDGKAALTSDAAHKAMSIYRTIYEKHYTSPDASQWEYGETNAALQSGSAAFAMQWSAAYADLTSKDKSPQIYDKIAVAPEPGDPHRTHVHTLAISLNKQSRHKDAARKWMAYLATPKAMTAYAQAGGIPSQPAVLKDNVKSNAAFAKIAENVRKYGYSLPTFTGTFQAMQSITEDLSSAWVGVDATDDALSKANDKLQSLLDR
ncbi:ABC transporter substrate-binding protein [Pararhizobium mangrovi]|uniref:Extracellular solute-binding protein n=1 Tax=Pararhizobium mangrovi TaxID=2590452 RepID=A0A506U3E2_9HYPH|nr:extracellular solute-binding protein [Pararhizobium mangrovi]TPW27554.1 extracellular solute-binding protein [Pararhizobium mangrovi]